MRLLQALCRAALKCLSPPPPPPPRRSAPPERVSLQMAETSWETAEAEGSVEPEASATVVGSRVNRVLFLNRCWAGFWSAWLLWPARQS